jgi:hypothetical protein
MEGEEMIRLKKRFMEANDSLSGTGGEPSPRKLTC